MIVTTRDEIVEKLSGAFDRASNGRAKLEALHDDSRIIEDLGLSSLDLLDLRCEMEELWQTTISNDEAAQLRTLGDAVKLIQQRLSTDG